MQKYELREKDLIKLGKQRVRVREIVHFDNNSSLIQGSTNRIVNDHNSVIHTNKKIYNELDYKLNPSNP